MLKKNWVLQIFKSSNYFLLYISSADRILLSILYPCRAPGVSSEGVECHKREGDQRPHELNLVLYKEYDHLV